MSASLVGSEMCIRDRCSAPLCQLTWPSRHPQPHERTLAARSVPGDSARAVSYTHLTLPTICSV
eukprot:12100719-Alexandrium_andersonii.AAC.1